MYKRNILASMLGAVFMAEANEGQAGGAPAGGNAKKKTEVTVVKMEDGREVGFAGKRRVLKETLIDESKILIDGDTITIQEGAVAVRMDFRNGSTRTFPLKLTLLPKFAGHGGEQKYGDELAAPADKPLSEDDMVVAVEDLDNQLRTEGWSAQREGGGVSGASVVIKALMEASGKSIEEIKTFLQKKLDAAKAANQKLSRKELYDSFRNPNSTVGKIVERLEKERLAKESKVNADEALGELGISESEPAAA